MLQYIYLYIYHILFRHIACSPIKWRHIIKVPPIIVWATLLCHPQLMSAPPQQSSLSSFESAAAARGTAAGGGLAGPTNNDVCLNGGGAALTLYTPCQFPPVRHSVNCCCPQLTTIFPQTQRISLFVTSGFAACSDLLSKAHSWPIWHLSVIRRKLSSNLSNWTQTGCWQLKCRHPEISVVFVNCQRLSSLVVNRLGGKGSKRTSFSDRRFVRAWNWWI